MTNPTDAEIIETGIDLADGWRGISFTNEGEVFTSIEIGSQEISIDDDLSKLHQYLLDALAAQLVRQVNAIDNIGITITPERVGIFELKLHELVHETRGAGALEIIRCIVESGVLEEVRV